MPNTKVRTFKDINYYVRYLWDRRWGGSYIVECHILPRNKSKTEEDAIEYAESMIEKFYTDIPKTESDWVDKVEACVISNYGTYYINTKMLKRVLDLYKKHW